MTQRRLDENRFIIADLHLGEGQYKNGVKNNLEYFEADKELYNFIQLIINEYSAFEARLELNLLGDTFDFLTVEYKGKILAEPTEDAAIVKIEKIFNAHPLVIKALRNFIQCGGKIKFFVGNHDLPLVWKSVQNLICHILTAEINNERQKNIPDCIQFIDHSKNFKEIKNNVLFIHGNDSEPAHKMPKNIFIESHRWQKLIPPLLNHPYGNHLVDLVNKLAVDSFGCKGNSWIGRLEPHWYVYLESLWKNWRFVLYATCMWLITPLCHQFTRRWWVRKSTSLLKRLRHNFDTMAVTIWNKVRGCDFTDYPKKILKKNDGIDIVITAHNHEFRHETTKHGTYIYPGNWCTSYVAQFPKIKLTWKRFEKIEKFFRILGAIRKIFHKKTCDDYLPKKREIYSFILCKFFKDGYKEVSLMRYNPENGCLEELN